MYGLPKSVCVVPVIPMSSKCSSHMFCLCCCMSEVISSFRSLRVGSQVFALLILFLFCLSALSMMFVKILLAVCMLVGMVV